MSLVVPGPPHSYEGVDTEILILEPNHGNNGVQQMSNSFRVRPTAEAHETKGNPNENRRRYIPVLFFEAVCEGICSWVCCNLLQTRKSARFGVPRGSPHCLSNEGANR